MIVTSEHAREALEVLTGKRIPSIMDMDDRVYEFYQGFLEPLLKNQGCQLALVTTNEKVFALKPDGPIEDLWEVTYGELPTHTFPSGAAIMYSVNKDDQDWIVCQECATKMQKKGWAVMWYWTVGKDQHNCEQCGEWAKWLEEM